MLSTAIVEGLVRATERTPFGGTGGYGPDASQLSATDPNSRYRQTIQEIGEAQEFLDFFKRPVDLTGKVVLDFGCGYGGKTITYAKTAERACGVDAHEHHLVLAKEYTAAIENLEYRLCGDFDLPYDDDTFDIVLSHGVLEHVANPEISLAHIRRVLKPGGLAYIMFPPYDGFYSHHLGYVCRLPMLHWWFRPETLIRAINRVLDETRRAKLNIDLQPDPKPAWNGSRKVLPGLNGLTGRDYEALIAEGFEIEYLEYRILGHRQVTPAHWLVYNLFSRPMMAAGLKDHVSTGLVSILRKPA